MQDVVSMLKNIDPKELGEAVAKAKAFVATPEGQEMLKKLKKGQAIEGLPVTTDEQNKLISELTKNPRIAKQLAAILGKR